MEMKFKDSGIEWIGRIPETWEVTKLNTLYTQRIEKVSDKDYPPLSVTMQGILPQLENAAKTNNGDDRKLVRVGDFAINSRSDRRGSCGISPYEGSVSLINIILKPRNEMNPRYYNWLFHSSLFSDEFYKWGHGIVDDLWTTRWQEMRNITVPSPTMEVQQRIADYLDEKCGEIDLLMGLQVQMIEKLKAYKLSVITEAVTKGLNPNAKLVPSGIDWIEEIPEGWTIKPFKELFRTGKGLSFTKADLVKEGVPVISYGQVHSKQNTGTSIIDELIRYVPEEIAKTGLSSKVNVGDFIFADTSEDLSGCGNCVYVDKEVGLYAGYHSVIAFSKRHLSNLYLAYLFLTDCWRSQIRSRVSGIKVFSISQTIINQTSIMLPPEDEQQSITAYLDEKCADIDRLIDLKQQKIEKLKYYKKSVIYEAVTGKTIIE